MYKPVFRPWVYQFIPLLVWFLLLILPFVSAPANIPAAMHHRFMVNVLISNSLLLAIFYIHTYLIYPLLNKKGWAVYLTALVVLLGCYWIYWFFVRSQPPHMAMHGQGPFRDSLQQHGFTPGQPGQMRHPMGGGPGMFMPVISPLIALLCSFCYRVILDNAARQQLDKERETNHLRTELNFLRSQINPHFLFNILNNLTSLARKKSDQLEPAIVNLSQLMRYMLYESDDNMVPLSKEVEYLKSYVDLQLLRFGEEVKVRTHFAGNYDRVNIGPMLLISLVENAFKHGKVSSGDTVILINLLVSDDEKTVTFKVMNEIDTEENKADYQTGIGLKNLRRRLDILYPAKHDLRIVNNGITFSAWLTIDLS